MIKNIIRYFMERNAKFENFVRSCQDRARLRKISHYKQKILNERDILYLMDIAKIHDKTFSPYKNCNVGKDIAIVATGPSLNKYKPLKNVITIGLNKALFCDKIELNYIFMQDYAVIKNYINELADEKYKKITKFFGIAPEVWMDTGKSLTECVIPEQIVLKCGARQYFQHCKEYMTPKFYKDIECNYIECAGSVVFAAMQFALYTNPKRIYIVGCDCTWGHFDENKGTIRKNHTLIRNWKELKKFRDIYYPETEIISVNPVGLRGLFIDLDQD